MASTAQGEKRSAASGRRKQASRPKGSFRLGRLIGRTLLALVTIAVVAPLLLVVAYRFVPPPITILMIERLIEGRGLDRRWMPLTQMSPALPRAAIAAEDARFCEHHGFDFSAIRAAMRHDENGQGALRGGSTISQQTAKNVFLWPGRSWVRKGLEAGFTVLIEWVWGKPRIMEVYLNTVEMGPGVYGVEAASERYFHVSARKVTPAEAARVIAILPSPLKWRAVNPGSYVRRRSQHIDAGEGAVGREGSADCVSRP